MKLPALKGDASREGNFLLYCAPSCLPVGRDPALKGGACGALAGHIFLSDESGEVVSLQRLVILPLNRRTLPNRKRDRYCSLSNLYEKVNNQV
jgi:hypothetical protein